MTVKRNIARAGVIGGLIARSSSAVLPISVTAQTIGNDPIKQLQDQIRKIQREYQSQIRGLQKQLDDLKAAQAASKTTPPPPVAPGLAVPPPGGILPPPVPGGPGAPPPPPAAVAAKHGIFGTGIDVSMANSY